MNRCTNCDEPVIWLDGMWMHDNGRLFCPIGTPGELLATPILERKRADPEPHGSGTDTP